MAFHFKDGWYFERIADGVVRIQQVSDETVVNARIDIDPNSWASIIATVSAAGETAESFQVAQEFHGVEETR